MVKKTINVAVTGAAGQIGYALIFRIASGEMFGSDTKVNLRLLELSVALPALGGVVMEMDDCAFPLLNSVVTTDDPNVAFQGADWALLVGSVPRKQGMERSDLLNINGGIFTVQGKALSDNAHPECKVLVVGNPCNTNCLIAKTVAKKLKPENFFAMTMLDQNRAVAQLAAKAKVTVNDVSNLAVWGNHSATQFPDFYHAKINGKLAPQVINDDQWLMNTFVETVQKRGAAVIKARGLSSAASAANAIIDTVRSLIRPTPKDQCFSVSVCSNGSYGIEKGLIFSFPIRSNGQNWEIVQNIKHNEFAQAKINDTYNELLSERDAVSKLL